MHNCATDSFRFVHISVRSEVRTRFSNVEPNMLRKTTYWLAKYENFLHENKVSKNIARKQNAF